MPNFPQLTIRSLIGKEFTIQLTHQDMFVHKREKFFLYKEFFHKNKAIINDFFQTEAFIIINEKDPIYITFNPKFDKNDRIKIKKNQIILNFVAYDISVNDLIKDILFKIESNNTKDTEYIMDYLYIFSEINVKENEQIMLAIIQNLDSRFIKYVSGELINSEQFWIKASSHFINDDIDHDQIQCFKFLPVTINIEFVFRLLQINSKIFRYLPKTLKLKKDIVIYCIQNKIVNSYLDILSDLYDDDDIIVECLTHFRHYIININGIYMSKIYTISFDKIIKIFDRLSSNQRFLDNINDSQLWWMVIEKNGLLLKFALKYITPESYIFFKTDEKHNVLHKSYYEFILFAVTNNGLALQYVPNHIKNDRIISAAIANNELASQYV
jgi:hypothetical protein